MTLFDLLIFGILLWLFDQPVKGPVIILLGAFIAKGVLMGIAARLHP